MLQYIIERLKEASTWKSLLGLVCIFGIALNPEQKDAIATFGTSAFLLLGVFLKDKFGGNKSIESVPTKEEVEVVEAEVEEKINERKRTKKKETNSKNSDQFLGD